MRGSQYIILWVFSLKHFNICVLMAIRYAAPIAGSADGSDGEVIEWCWYHPYEEGTDPEFEGLMTTCVD